MDSYTFKNSGVVDKTPPTIWTLQHVGWNDNHLGSVSSLGVHILGIVRCIGKGIGIVRSATT